jgi:hypothetical protein
MSKNKEIVEVVQLPLLKQEFLFVVNVKTLKRLKKYFDDPKTIKRLEYVLQDYDEVAQPVDAYLAWSKDHEGYDHMVLVLRTINDDVLNTLVHEIVHIMQHIRRIYFPNDEDVEFEAYLTAHIFSVLCDILRNNGLIK